MSSPCKGDSLAPSQRRSLPRQRIRKHYDFRPEVYSMLRRLKRADELLRPESETATIERLIQTAFQQLP